MYGLERTDDTWAPISGVKVSAGAGGVNWAGDVTDSDGSFTVGIPGLYQSCLSYTQQRTLMATFRFTKFDPDYPTGFYYLTKQTAVTAEGNASICSAQVGHSLAAQSAVTALTSANATDTHNNLVNFTVDVAILNGQGIIENVIGSAHVSTLTLGDEITESVTRSDDKTTYAYTKPGFTYEPQPQEDFNGDGQIDQVVLNPATGEVKVWLAGTDQAEDPYLIKQADYIPHDANHRGLLEQISTDDLQNTDVYVFRVSNGQLLVAQDGLKPDQRNWYYGGGDYEDQAMIYYRMMMRGPASFHLPGSREEDINEWQTAMHMDTEDAQGIESDFLRPGEKIRVILINRSTGYMGSAYTSVQDVGASRQITFSPEMIRMRPPNLKIKVERQRTIETGATAGEVKEHIIGFEGSGLTSDDYIKITTNWTDWNGIPLPEKLDGYTGRLAKIIGENLLANIALTKAADEQNRISDDLDGLLVKAANNPNNRSDLNEFEIKPGTNIQLVYLPQDAVDNSHYYIHVSGETPGKADFSSLGGQEAGDLFEYRPRLYAPFMIPLYDEDATIAAREADPQADPVYNWAYRPEMQFSLFELEEMEYQEKEEDTGEIIQTIDLTNPGEDSLPPSSYYDFMYYLTGDELDMLPQFGPDRELVFSLGGYELLATTDECGNLSFSNIDDAALDASDVLTLRLYQNGDDPNVLWEYALHGLLIVSSDNAESNAEKSFIITTKENILQSDGEKLDYPQDPFLVQLFNPIDAGDTYRWEIEVSDNDKYGTFEFKDPVPPNPITDGKWDSGLLTDPQYRKLKFKPVELVPRHDPASYTKYVGGTREIDIQQKNPQYTYDIKVTVISQSYGQRVYTGTIQMDQKDMIRQEFINHLNQVSDITDIVRVPTRGELIEPDSLQSVLTGDWSDADYQYLYERHMSLLATLVRDAFRGQPDRNYPTPNDGTGSLPSGEEQFQSLRLNSGWRNPERNEIVGGATTSRHMVGRAVDIGCENVLMVDTTERAMLMWTLWNAAETLPFSQADGPRFRWLLEDSDGDSTNSPYGT